MNEKFHFLKEVWFYLKQTKRIWLAPLVILIVILSFVVIFAETSVLAPIIYTLF